MKKFVFISLMDSFENKNVINIGYLCSALKKVEGLTTEVLFYDFSQLDSIPDDVFAHNPWMIGISILQYNFEIALKLATMLKSKKQDIKIVFGGLEASRYAEYILNNCEAVDYISLGEGEISLPEMCKRVLNNESLMGCKGTYYRENGEIIKNEHQELVLDLDTLEFPDRSFCDERHTVFNVIGSRGCYGGCTYCESNCIFTFNHGNKVRTRSMKNMLDEIESIISKSSYAYIGFADYTFSTDNQNSMARLEELYEGIIERKFNLQFSLFARAEQITDEYITLLLKLREVGLDRILVGLEFATSEELKLYKKTASLAENERAMDLLYEHGFLNGEAGIIVDIGYIPFHPYATFDTLRKNIAFLRKYKIANINHAILNRMYISASTKITNLLEMDGLLKHDKSKPLIDPYCYDFKDPRIGKIYVGFVKAMEELELQYIPTQILTNYTLYSKYFESLFPFSEVNNRYVFVTECILNILNEIIDTSEKGEVYNHESSTLFLENKKKLESVSHELITMNNKIAKQLLKIDKLAISNMNYVYVKEAKQASKNI